MPQQTVYIRNGDMDKWKALENKAEFISNALRGNMDADINRISKLMDKPSPEYIIPTYREPLKPSPPDPELGYPCCQKTKPCIHWVWDGIASVYKNTLTGATKEV